MEYQTWTRKANAIAAVKKLLADVPMEYVIMGIDAHNVSVAGSEWAVIVEVDNVPSEADALQEILGDKARVKALRPEPVPVEARPTAREEWTTEMQSRSKINPSDDARHESESAHMGADPIRRSAAGERKLTCAAGKNPFIRGKSYDAWEWLVANPGATFAECKAAGCRMRAISHSITMGWVVVE